MTSIQAHDVFRSEPPSSRRPLALRRRSFERPSPTVLGFACLLTALAIVVTFGVSGGLAQLTAFTFLFAAAGFAERAERAPRRAGR